MRFVALVLSVLCLAVLFCGLGSPGLVDEREARDGLVAREMLTRGELMMPRTGGEVRFEKPAPGYALDIAGAIATPQSPVGPRTFKALAAVALVLLTASIGAQHFGARAGLCAGGVLLTSLALPLAARTDGTQVLASLLGWVGCAGLADALFGRPAGRGLRLVVTWSALAATLVCAGPLPALWPLAGLALYLRLARDREGWRTVRPLVGVALILALALPWYVAMTQIHGTAFLARVPFFPYATEPRAAWYAGVVRVLAFLVVGFFPWSTLLPGAALHAATWWRLVPRRRAETKPVDPRQAPLARERREESAAHFFIACLAAALVPILFYPAAPLPAALAALPAAALLCGRLLDHLIEDPRRVAAHTSYAGQMLALTGSSGAILLALVATRVRDAGPELRLLAAIMLLASWAPFLAQFMGRHRLAAALMTLPVAIGAPIVTMRLMPAMEEWLNTRAVAEAMDATAPALAPLVLIDPAPPSLRYYLPHPLVTGEPLKEAIVRHRAQDGSSYVAFRPSRESAVARAASGPLEILIRTPTMVLARVYP